MQVSASVIISTSIIVIVIAIVVVDVVVVPLLHSLPWQRGGKMMSCEHTHLHAACHSSPPRASHARALRLSS